jgi:hypothetical protein
MQGEGHQRRLVALCSRHAAFEAEIQDEMKRPQPDALRVRELKKQKLRIKEEIAAFSALQPA